MKRYAKLSALAAPLVLSATIAAAAGSPPWAATDSACSRLQESFAAKFDCACSGTHPACPGIRAAAKASGCELPYCYGEPGEGDLAQRLANVLRIDGSEVFGFTSAYGVNYALVDAANFISPTAFAQACLLANGVEADIIFARFDDGAGDLPFLCSESTTLPFYASPPYGGDTRVSIIEDPVGLGRNCFLNLPCSAGYNMGDPEHKAWCADQMACMYGLWPWDPGGPVWGPTSHFITAYGVPF